MERSSVSTGVRKPGKHDRCADHRDMTIAVKNGVKPQTNKQFRVLPLPHSNSSHCKPISVKDLESVGNLSWSTEGLPYVQLGKKILDCQHGKDSNNKKKKEYRKNQDVNYQQRGVPRASSSIKMGCPAKTVIKEVLIFPDIQECTTKREKSKILAKVKKKSERTEKKFLVYIPDISLHAFHPVGKLAANVQRLDKSLVQKINELMNLGYRSATEIQTQLEGFVRATMVNVDEENRRFFPSLQIIRNHMGLHKRKSLRRHDEVQESIANLENQVFHVMEGGESSNTGASCDFREEEEDSFQQQNLSPTRRRRISHSVKKHSPAKKRRLEKNSPRNKISLNANKTKMAAEKKEIKVEISEQVVANSTFRKLLEESVSYLYQNHIFLKINGILHTISPYNQSSESTIGIGNDRTDTSEGGVIVATYRDETVEATNTIMNGHPDDETQINNHLESSQNDVAMMNSHLEANTNLESSQNHVEIKHLNTSNSVVSSQNNVILMDNDMEMSNYLERSQNHAEIISNNLKKNNGSKSSQNRVSLRKFNPGPSQNDGQTRTRSSDIVEEGHESYTAIPLEMYVETINEEGVSVASNVECKVEDVPVSSDVGLVSNVSTEHDHATLTRKTRQSPNTGHLPIRTVNKPNTNVKLNTDVKPNINVKVNPDVNPYSNVNYDANITSEAEDIEEVHYILTPDNRLLKSDQFSGYQQMKTDGSQSLNQGNQNQTLAVQSGNQKVKDSGSKSVNVGNQKQYKLIMRNQSGQLGNQSNVNSQSQSSPTVKKRKITVVRLQRHDN